MYIRQKYLKWMENYSGTPLVKVLVGMRRVGKSTLLNQFRDRIMKKECLKAAQVLFVDKESLEFRDLRTEVQLHKKVVEYFKKVAGKKILFVDEIQEIENWEKAISSLLKTGSYDIYITGSNANLLSSDLATFLAGRYVELSVFPLSYEEWLGAHRTHKHSAEAFERYLTFGGFPGLTRLPQDASILFQTLDALYNSIILRDVVERYQIRNSELLANLTAFFFDNVGNLVTAKSISDYLKSQHIKVSVESVQMYMGYLESCFAIHRVRRYDLKGKRYLEISEKHYLGDLGLRHATLGYRPSDIGQLLENVVYLELRRRGYSVAVGKLDHLEIDFIAEKEGQRIYLQVAYLLASKETRKREFLPLQNIKDSYPKFVLSMDPLRQDHEGIRHLFLPDFLLDG